MPPPNPVCGLNFLHLRAFWQVAREGSVARAAEALRVSPSAVSCRRLESMLRRPAVSILFTISDTDARDTSSRSARRAWMMFALSSRIS